jgi:hypothetical protein
MNMRIPTVEQVDWDEMPNFTRLIGNVTCPYEVLKSLFGRPRFLPDGKVDCEWTLRLTTPSADPDADEDDFDTHYVTIYNWKDGYNYCGTQCTPIHLITKWNIGGPKKGWRGEEIVREMVAGLLSKSS